MIDISIIIPIRNAKKYIIECIDSVVEQERITKELICIYDDPEENSLDIIRQYSELYSWINLYQQPGTGPSSARNYGLAKAKGKYVAFLDADDFYIDRNALYMMMAAAEQYGAKVCFGLRQVINSFTNEIEKTPDFRDLFYENSKSKIVDFLDYQNDFHFHSYIYEREMLLYNGLLFPIEFPLWEDPIFLLNVLIKVRRVCICGVEFYCYRYLNHIPNYGKRIGYVLEGIYHNMCMSSEYNLDLLQHRLIERLNVDYYDIIRLNFSKEVLKSLIKIDDAKIITDKINYLEELCLNKGVEESIFLNRYIYILQHGVNLEDELFNMGYKDIVLYGCGNYGHVFFRTLNHEKLNVVAVVDTHKEGEFEGLEIQNRIPESVRYDAILVTPLFNKEIIELLSSNGYECVISFVDIVNELFLRNKKI